MLISWYIYLIFMVFESFAMTSKYLNFLKGSKCEVLL